jgi:hypothetical protein
MVRVVLQSDGEPATFGQLMFGAEFVKHVRGNKPGQMTVTSLDDHGHPTVLFAMDVEDVVCDGCNTVVAPHDPCLLAYNRLSCWTCATRYFLGSLVPTLTEAE